jgi:hypothetical protein
MGCELGTDVGGVTVNVGTGALACPAAALFAAAAIL